MQDVYKYGKIEEAVVYGRSSPKSTATSQTVKFHQSTLGRHIYLVDQSSSFGSEYNPFAIMLLKGWLQSVTVAEVLERRYSPLENILKVSEALAPLYVEHAGKLQEDRRRIERSTQPVGRESATGANMPALSNNTKRVSTFFTSLKLSPLVRKVDSAAKFCCRKQRVNFGSIQATRAALKLTTDREERNRRRGEKRNKEKGREERTRETEGTR